MSDKQKSKEEIRAMVFDEIADAFKRYEKGWYEESKATEEIKASNWKASFDYSAGTMIAELLPDFSTPNKNGFFLDKSLKEKIIAKLNSGKVFLTDSHGRTLRDILGKVTKGFDKGGKIKIEADLDPDIDPKIDKLLTKYKDNLGVSLEGPGAGYCTVCGQRVHGMERCFKHPKASIVVKEFDLKKVSLTDDPAWETSKVENYI